MASLDEAFRNAAGGFAALGGLGLERQRLGQIAQRTALDERQIALAEEFQAATLPLNVQSIEAQLQGLKTQEDIQQAELEDIRNPAGAITRLIKGLREGLGLTDGAEAAGAAAGAMGGTAGKPVGAATQAVQRMLGTGGVTGTGAGELTNLFNDPAVNLAAQYGGPMGSPQLALGLMLESLPVEMRVQVIDAFKAPLDRVRSTMLSFAGATEQDIGKAVDQAVMGAAQNALGMARQLQARLDADKAWIGRNGDWVKDFFSRRLGGGGPLPPGFPEAPEDMYRILGPAQIQSLRLAQENTFPLPQGISERFNSGPGR